MARFKTLFYAYRKDGRVREPLHADPECHHLQRVDGSVRPVSAAVPVARDVCGTCAGDVETVTDDETDEETDDTDDVVTGE